MNSHHRAVTRITDPIHNNIKLTCFDREVVDSEYFQRLHFVLQNSTTYVAFPSNKNSRFSHSLGVCHLTGELFTNAIRNSSPEDLTDFFHNASALLTRFMLSGEENNIANTLIGSWKKTISGMSGFRHTPTLRSEDGLSLESLSLDSKYPIRKLDNNELEHEVFSAGFLADTLWQSIRICGLAHDIGHLPMSHSLEHAATKFKDRLSQYFPEISKIKNKKKRKEKLDEYFAEITCSNLYVDVFTEFNEILKVAYGDDKSVARVKNKFEKSPLHERRSIYILLLLYKRGNETFDSDLSTYSKLIYNLSFLILLSSVTTYRKSSDDEKNQVEINNSAFRFMKLLIAGSVDGDRMDYTVRDGHACGSTIGQYNISQIVENVTLFKNKDNHEFQVGFFYRALPAIENFFVQRHLGYKQLIYHRTSSRSEACLQQLMLELLEYCYENPTDKMSEYFQKLGYFCNSSDGKHKILPVYSKNEVKESRDLWNTEQIPFLDDASLRSFLEWFLIDISQEPQPERRLETIYLLGRIFLKRDFNHIYDPFKEKNFTKKTIGALRKASTKLDICPDKVDKYLDMFFDLLSTNENYRSQILEKTETKLSKLLGNDITFFHCEQEPKIYDHAHAKSKGEELYLVYNGVSVENEQKSQMGGVVPATPIIDASNVLRTMPQLLVDEFRIRFYFVKRDIKTNYNLKKTVDDAANATLDETMEFALNGILKIQAKLNTPKQKKG